MTSPVGDGPRRRVPVVAAKRSPQRTLPPPPRHASSRPTGGGGQTAIHTLHAIPALTRATTSGDTDDHAKPFAHNLQSALAGPAHSAPSNFAVTLQQDVQLGRARSCKVARHNLE